MIVAVQVSEITNGITLIIISQCLLYRGWIVLATRKNTPTPQQDLKSHRAFENLKLLLVSRT